MGDHETFDDDEIGDDGSNASIEEGVVVVDEENDDSDNAAQIVTVGVEAEFDKN